MQSKAATVEQYLKEMPPDRRAAIETVRSVLRKNMDKKYREGMAYGMIGYCVPHSIYPAGYHCDPKMALPFVALASQKNHMSLYMMCHYSNPNETDWFAKAWDKEVKAGRAKKLDMGKSCIRFNKVEDLALDVIADAIRRMPVPALIEFYERAILSNNKQAAARREAKGSTTKPPAKKSAAKRAPAKQEAMSRR